ERLLVEAAREGPLGAREKLLVAGTVDEIANLAAGLTLGASVAAGAKLAHFGAALAPPELDSLRGQTLRGADPRRLDLEAGSEVEGLERHEGLREVPGASHRAVVLQHDRVAPPSEDPGNLLAQIVASRQPVLRHAELAADRLSVGNQGGVGQLPHQAERDQRRRVGVDHGPQVGAAPVRQLMEGELDGGAVLSEHPPAGLDLY